jgi:hypothetical protein
LARWKLWMGLAFGLIVTGVVLLAVWHRQSGS